MKRKVQVLIPIFFVIFSIFTGFKISSGADKATVEISKPSPQPPRQVSRQVSENSLESDKSPKSVTISKPISVQIPSINLDSTVISLGTDSLGNMDVPSGKTNNVGWYKNGIKPGDVGTAVLDAHVFAAFRNLHAVEVGDDIYVKTTNGNQLHFRVEKVKTYSLNSITPAILFGQNNGQNNKIGGKYLNLITCAGKLTLDHSTYDHRLVVFAVLVS